MKTENEKEQQANQANEQLSEQVSNENSHDTKNVNWDKHQQIDEEGNEVKPDDVK